MLTAPVILINGQQANISIAEDGSFVLPVDSGEKSTVQIINEAGIPSPVYTLFSDVPEQVSYTVNHYVEKTDLSYELKDSETLSAQAGSLVTAQAKTYDHCSLNEGKSNLTGLAAADGSLVLNLYYDLERYTVTFELDGGTWTDTTQEPVQVLPYGSAIYLPAAPEKNGYTFNGWMYNGYTFQPGHGGPVESDMTFTASWSQVVYDTYRYKMRYYLEQLDGSYKLDHVVNLKEPAGTYVEAEILEFEHYHLNEDKSVLNGYVQIGGGPDLNLYYDLDVHTVSLNLNGGAFKDDTPLETELKYGSTFTLPDAPAKEGHEFLGWKLNDEILQPEDEVTVTGDLSITAQWKEQEQYPWSVVYYLEQPDGSYVIDSEVSGTKPAGETVEAEARSYEHYHLNEEKSQLSGTVTESGLVLNVFYDLDVFTVSIDLDGGSLENIQPETEVKYGTAFTLPAEPTKDGFVFLGWKVNDDILQPAEEMTVTQNLSITAQWEEEKVELNYSRLELICQRAQNAVENESRYIHNEAWDAFILQLEASQSLIGNASSQEEIDQCVKALNACWLEIRLVPDEELLKSL